MSDLRWIEVYALAVIHIGLVFAVAFPLYYRRSTWRDTEIGRALMFKGTALAVLFVVSVVGYWWPFPGYDYLYSLTLTTVVAGIIYQFAVLRKHQKEARANTAGEF